MNIVCATSLAMGREAFSTLGDVTLLPESEINAASVRGADAVITRSKVRIGRALLEGSQVSFVGTATAGTDHMDLNYLGDRGIAWTAAPGCNANSVAEYVVAALLCLAGRHGFELNGKTIAVIGVGHIGKLVVEKARVLGLTVLLNDPPLFAQTGNEHYRPLDEILPRADIVTLHVPLLETGPFATRALVNATFMSRLKRGAIFINASRGEVADTATLLAARREGVIGHAVLDVFENEPNVPQDLVARADIVTPHIAGYSHEGKVNGTFAVYREARNFFEVPAAWSPPPAAGLPAIQSTVAGQPEEDIVRDVVRQAYDIAADDAAFRADPAQFSKRRAEYPVRHEFHQRMVQLLNAGESLKQKIHALGFQSLEK